MTGMRKEKRMYCHNCGKEVEENWVKCPYCASALGKEVNKINSEHVSNAELVAQNNISERKKIEEKSFWKYVLLTVVTCGIYGIYTLYTFTEDINNLCEGDGKKSPNYIIVLLLTACTCGIYGLYWWYKQAERIKEVSSKYGVPVKENGTTILCWQILGSLLAGLGAFVALYIMFDNVNRLALVYNGEKTAEEVQAMGEAHPKLVRNVIIAAGAILLIYIAVIVLTVVSTVKFAETDMVVDNISSGEDTDLEDMDLEDLIGESEDTIKELGFEQEDEDLYEAFDGAVEITIVDGKVSTIAIEDNGEDLPSLGGVKMGMPKDEAYAILQEKYSETIEDEESKIFYNAETKKGVYCETIDEKISLLGYMDFTDILEEYIFPDSDSKYLSEDEVRSVEADNLSLGRNEIFARHGYIFESEELQEYFESTSWYEGTIPANEFDADSVFNDFEKKNVELIKKVEDEINGPSKEEQERQAAIDEAYNAIAGKSFLLTGTELVIKFRTDGMLEYNSSSYTVDTCSYSVTARYENYKDNLYAYEHYVTIDGVEYWLEWYNDGSINLSADVYGDFDGWYEQTEDAWF